MLPGSDWSAGVNGASATAIADAELFERIGTELRASYQALMEEPVPEHLIDLIRRMDDGDEEAG